MAAERGGKYLHLNARSIPPFRCFFFHVTPSSVWPSARRLDREPAACVTIASASECHRAGLVRRRPGHARGIIAGRDREATRRPATSSRSSRGIHHEAGDLIGHETISDLVSPSISHDAISGS